MSNLQYLTWEINLGSLMEVACLAMQSASDMKQEDVCALWGLILVLGTLYRLVCSRITHDLVLMCQAQIKK